MRQKPAKSEVLLSKVAARQHGVVSAPQLRAAGLDAAAIRRRAIAGRLHRVHRGVYAVGQPKLTFEGRCLAAVLALGGGASGGGAVASHWSAAGLWDILPQSSGVIHVTLPSGNGRARRPGVAIHRSPALLAGFRTRRSNVPVTTPARTLRDLKRTAPDGVVQRAFRRALDLRLVRPDVLGPEPDFTRSKLEKRFLAVCRRHRLPLPEVNARVGAYEVDFLWREQRVIVETDSWRHHGDRASFEADRARDAELQALGYRVLRFTWRQVRDHSATVVSSLRGFLGST